MTMNKRRAVLFALCFLVGVAAQGQTFTTLYNFGGGSDGEQPVSGVIQDPSGNLYGTTDAGGVYKGGTVYEISAAGTETVLYSFEGGTDGDSPTTPLLRVNETILYGTTQNGGPDNWGTLFKIDAAGKETILHTFTGGSDGGYPDQGLSMGKSGVIFGTTVYGGSHHGGMIFKVDSSGNFTILYSFNHSPDGGFPTGGHLMMDESGNLYGATSGRGHNQGVVYKLSVGGKLSLLHSFKGGTKDGCNAFGSVVRDQAGNLYGTTYGCGSNGYGVIWKLSKTGKETILHDFIGGASDGCYPYAGVALDLNGNLYGVTPTCGAYGYGALYELSADGTYTLLHSFEGSDGIDPLGEVLWTAIGTLYGTTVNGGTYGQGTVWKYVP